METPAFCVRCNRFMVKKSSGYIVLLREKARYTMPDNTTGKPYKEKRADLFRCEDCGFEVLAEFGGDIENREIIKDDTKEHESGNESIFLSNNIYW